MHGDASESERHLSAFVKVRRNVQQLHLLSSLKCKNLWNELRSCVSPSSVSVCVPAGGSVPRDYFTPASVQAVVRLHGAGALTRQAVHGAVSRIAQTLGLIGPTVHHAAWKLVAGQELTGVRLVSWNRRGKRLGRWNLINISAASTCPQIQTRN